uniref:Microtubule-binding protein TANGLED1 n=1 Tax=Oryza glumipatula TaxID=40148 RepID=A0A0D9YRW9_9ORYZ
MVARSPDARQSRQTAAAAAAAAALNPALVRETLKKVDRCMARLQELQYTVAGGAKVVSGVSLSPRSTRGYLRTSLRCKQETVRQVLDPDPLMRATPARKTSPNGKFGGSDGGATQWRRMSLPAMLLGETVLEIVQASKFASDIVAVVDAGANKNREAPKTPNPVTRTRKVNAEATPLRARRAREKQSQRGTARAEASTPPSLGRVRSRIQFKPASPLGRPSVSANRVSPRNRPWAKKTVMFPNPAFLASTSSAAYDSPSPSKKQKRFYKTRSPIIARQTPHKFLVKSPPSSLGSKLKSHGKLLPSRPFTVSPPGKVQVAAAAASVSKTRRCTFSPSRLVSRLVSSPGKAQAAASNNNNNKGRRCSFSPSRLATRLVSPIKARLSLNRSRDGGVHGGGGGMVCGLKQRPGVSMTVRTVSSRIPS